MQISTFATHKHTSDRFRRKWGCRLFGLVYVQSAQAYNWSSSRILRKLGWCWRVPTVGYTFVFGALFVLAFFAFALFSLFFGDLLLCFLCVVAFALRLNPFVTVVYYSRRRSESKTSSPCHRLLPFSPPSAYHGVRRAVGFSVPAAPVDLHQIPSELARERDLATSKYVFTGVPTPDSTRSIAHAHLSPKFDQRY